MGTWLRRNWLSLLLGITSVALAVWTLLALFDLLAVMKPLGSGV